MFVKYDYIPEAHKATLSSVIAQHNVVTESLLARLYSTALKLFKEGSQEAAGTFTHYIKAAAGVVAGATDEKTGIYVQLAGPEGSPSPTLTVGQKWAMQAHAPGLSQIATKHW